MGNEASISQQPENDGLQPPSQTQPSEPIEHSNLRSSTQTINAIFRRGGHKTDDGHDTTRTDAENGHMPFGSPTASSLSLSAQQLQAQQYMNSHMRSPELLYVNSQIPAQHQPYDPRQQSHQQLLQQQHYQHAPSGGDASTDPMDTTQPPQPMVGVMYATDSSSHATMSRSTGSSFRNGGKVVREGGRKVINSLKNLSLGQRGSKKKMQKDENEWETKWDEDDDDSDEEITDSKIGSVIAAAHLRPGMDGGHSSPSPVMPMMVQISPMVLLSEEPTLRVAVATRQQATVISAVDVDGLEWDTGTGLDVITQQVSKYERPNIQMFLPLLRVLGKGSFGKVRAASFVGVD